LIPSRALRMGEQLQLPYVVVVQRSKPI